MYQMVRIGSQGSIGLAAQLHHEAAQAADGRQCQADSGAHHAQALRDPGNTGKSPALLAGLVKEIEHHHSRGRRYLLQLRQCGTGNPGIAAGKAQGIAALAVAYPGLLPDPAHRRSRGQIAGLCPVTIFDL